MEVVPILLVHGGAGDIPAERKEGKIKGVKLAAKLGYKKLMESGSALDGVEAAVRSMELDDYFNAGYGSVLTSEGNIEMEASIMEGTNLKAGCCTLVKDILHPITLAKRVLEQTPHNFLGGDGVMDFARQQKIEILDPPGQLVTEYAIEALEEWKEHQKRGGIKFARTEIGSKNQFGKGEVGTVGAVAIDKDGNIAVATSTGGITGKLPGRIGDTPLLGSGTYADNNLGGVSTTGHGETIMKFCLAHAILKRIEYLGENAQEATERACVEMTKRLEGTAGAITISKAGDVGVSFTSKRMAWAYQKGNLLAFGIEKGEKEEETVNN